MALTSMEAGGTGPYGHRFLPRAQRLERSPICSLHAEWTASLLGALSAAYPGPLASISAGSVEPPWRLAVTGGKYNG